MNKRMQCINNAICTVNFEKVLSDYTEDDVWFPAYNKLAEVCDSESFYILSVADHIVAFIEKDKLTRFDVRDFWVFKDKYIDLAVRQAIRKFFLMYSGSDGIQFTYKDIF